MAIPSSAEGNYSAGVGSAIPAGVVGGLAGGIVFGLAMQFMGMIPMIAMLVGSESAAVGWIIHLGISSFIGATFALLVRGRAIGTGKAAGLGVAYGAVWWVLGPLLIMPARLGMPLFMINDMAIQSLIGHLLYGAILGITYSAVRPRLGFQ
ncbi:hypothetical protein BH23ACT12_BH23ACT12_22870 [soil metagenome]